MSGRRRIPAAALAAALAAPAPLALAGEAEVVAATATSTGESWRFDVTLRHADEGWEHYADEWRVLGPDGAVYGVRELAHPHVDEQPFTRSLSGVSIPPGVGRVTIEARDSRHGRGGAAVTVELVH